VPRGDESQESASAHRSWLHWLLALLAVVAFYFAPFFFQGRHIVPFNFERPSSTGIPGNGKPITIHQRFPGHDNSPILIHYQNVALTGQYVREGTLPTWNPYLGTGQPAMGNGQVYPFSPFLWPFYLHPNPWVFTSCPILGTLWGAWGAYLWLAAVTFLGFSLTLPVNIWNFSILSESMADSLTARLVALGDSAEVDRHAIGAAVLVHIGALLGLLVVLDAAVTRLSPEPAGFFRRVGSGRE